MGVSEDSSWVRGKSISLTAVGKELPAEFSIVSLKKHLFKGISSLHILTAPLVLCLVNSGRGRFSIFSR